MIPVTKTFLPPVDEYSEWVKKAFESQWITNRGDLVNLLESKLKSYLGVDWLTITNNGTIPLQIALKLLGKGGEVITTPFSYVATTSVIVWENCKPVFADIDPEYLTIDENKIEAAITEKTTCILATHVYGNPCNIEAIDKIAKKHNLPVIYDAAHCFGVTYRGKSIFEYGDVSTCSFHATKLFHTAEGGAMFTKSEALRHQLFYSHNFGHDGPLAFHGLGVNGKISELQAAMGLAVFPYMEQIISERKQIVDQYDATLDFKNLRKVRIREHTKWNYSYYPVILESEKKLLEVQKALNSREIYPRRYFYPSLNTIDYAGRQKMAVSEDIAGRVLCLPLFTGLERKIVEDICRIVC